ncbi:NACHT domain-containing protein [Dolichospermum heterosporum]|uniref:NACHT domain-containing protein n=1 Tax=Dolichospermum heterosporum TAC447 TaxID=747523 RepID=A0ABY5LXL8_9CYAN|nr:NACHT domain-containing protein [Dolichospermum heterosporum]UUO16010.1 NACHT domain-containing protein [Dolichospermum heterosporum TAC447]
MFKFKPLAAPSNAPGTGLGGLENVPIDDLVEEVRSLTRDKFKNLHGTMQMLRVSDPVPVDEIYIDLNILDQVSSYRTFSDWRKDFQPDWRNFDRLGSGAVKQKGLPALSKVKDCRRLMVFGKPGSGKTTFLKSLGILCIDKKNQFDEQDYVPIFIRLNKFAEYIHPLKLQTANQEQLHLFDYIYTREFCSWDEINKQVIQTILSNSRTLVLLDGIDEVSKQDRDFVVEEVEKFCNKFYNNRFIISCRTQTHKYKLPGFTEVEIDDFKPEQAKKFIKHWFKVVEKSSDSDNLASKLTRLLEQPENVQIAELSVTPVLLNLICFVFRNGDDLPTNRAELYKKGIKDLLRGLDESKGINREKLYPNINLDETEKLLTELAANFFKENEYFPQQEKLETFIVSRLGVKKYESEKVLKSIEAKSGLLIERSEGFWSFSHLTFQEYFTAKYIVENKQIEQLVKEHLTDTRWREVFLLTAELMGDEAGNLLSLMQAESQKYINKPKLQKLLGWADEITSETAGNIKPIGKRAIAITYAKAYNLANTYAKLKEIAVANANAIFIIDSIVYSYSNSITSIYTKDRTHSSAILYANAYVNAIAKAHDITYDINLAIETTPKLEELKIFNNEEFKLAEKLEEHKSKIPNDKKQQEEFNTFAEGLRKTLLEAFNFIPEMIDLSEEELKTLDEKYLYANKLIIDCKKSAIGETCPLWWQEIEERMLKPNL